MPTLKQISGADTWISLKEAKRLCKQQIGRLPRPGYEVKVLEVDNDGQKITVYLVNDCPGGRVREYRTPMTNEWCKRHGVRIA